MLGSMSEADDALQEAWLRVRDQDPERVENMQAWLTTVVGRVCLNMLRSRRALREEPSEVRVPDPVVSLVDTVDRVRRRWFGRHARRAHDGDGADTGEHRQRATTTALEVITQGSTSSF
jgi:DNA-directed RNA polymerase specialized sigma24 family protein